MTDEDKGKIGKRNRRTWRIGRIVIISRTLTISSPGSRGLSGLAGPIDLKNP